MRRYGLVDIPEIAEDIDAVPISRTITIDGTTFDLSANRSFTTKNIYNTDGTLTGNRTVTMGSYTLSFEKDIFVNSVKIGRGTSSSLPEYNTVVGNSAYNSNTSGFSNTAVGYSAMNASTAGNANSAFGAFALLSLSGSAVGTQTNTAIGRSALYQLVTGESNTGIGANVFGFLTSGQHNTGVGKQALLSLTSGSFNIIVGASVGTPSVGIVTGSYNTIIGSQITGLASTLNNNIVLADGQGNIRIRAFDTGNVTINSNTDSGYKFDCNGTARISSTITLSDLAGTGTRMVVADATGILSTQSLPSGSNIYNTDGTLTGNRTVTMGSYTLSFEKDIFISGVLVGKGVSSTFPTTNTVLGNSTFTSNVSGFSNVSIGSSCLNLSTSGAGNTAVGATVLSALTTGQSNTSIGNASMRQVQTGSNNTAIGRQALDRTLGNFNIGVGVLGGYTFTTGEYNIHIGSTLNPGIGITTGSYNTIIGNQISGLTSSLSNNIILSDGQGNIRIRAFNTGNVTINSNTDSGYKFDCNGTARIQDNLTISDAKNIILDTTTGTKIGTSTSQKLALWNTTPDVQPTTAITAAAFVANTSGIVDDTATFGGYTIGQIVAALKRIGALA